MKEKKFDKKLMHSSRKKLVDMVLNGEYDKNTTIGFEKAKKSRKVGEKWESDGYIHEKMEGWVKTEPKNDTGKQIRDYLEKLNSCKHPDCEKGKYSKLTHADKVLIKKIGYCVDCNAKVETEFAIAGLAKEYRDYRTYTRMLIYGRTKLEQLKESQSTVKQQYEIINGDGSKSVWELPKPVDEVKKELQVIIDNSIEDIKEVEKNRNIIFEKIKEHNYEHLL